MAERSPSREQEGLLETPHPVPCPGLGKGAAHLWQCPSRIPGTVGRKKGAAGLCGPLMGKSGSGGSLVRGREVGSAGWRLLGRVSSLNLQHVLSKHPPWARTEPGAGFAVGHSTDRVLALQGPTVQGGRQETHQGADKQLQT